MSQRNRCEGKAMRRRYGWWALVELNRHLRDHQDRIRNRARRRLDQVVVADALTELEAV